MVKRMKDQEEVRNEDKWKPFCWSRCGQEQGPHHRQVLLPFDADWQYEHSERVRGCPPTAAVSFGRRELMSSVA